MQVITWCSLNWYIVSPASPLYNAHSTEVYCIIQYTSVLRIKGVAGETNPFVPQPPTSIYVALLFLQLETIEIEIHIRAYPRSHLSPLIPTFHISRSGYTQKQKYNFCSSKSGRHTCSVLFSMKRMTVLERPNVLVRSKSFLCAPCQQQKPINSRCGCGLEC